MLALATSALAQSAYGPLLAGDDALAEYSARRLDVIETRVTSVDVRGGHPDERGMFWFVVDAAGHPLTGAQLATRIGDDERARALRRQQAGRAWTGLGLVGAGAAAVLVPMATRFQGPSIDVPVGVALPLYALATGGAVFGGFWSIRGALRLRHPAATWTRPEAEVEVREYNADLRRELLGGE